MAIKNQIQTVKENWLIVVIILIAFVAFSGLSNNFYSKTVNSISDSSGKQYSGKTMQ